MEFNTKLLSDTSHKWSFEELQHYCLLLCFSSKHAVVLRKEVVYFCLVYIPCDVGCD